MTRDEFVREYKELTARAMFFANKAMREGLLALEEGIDREKANRRDILEYGMGFVVDGVDRAIIGKILSNIAAQETDEYRRILKTIGKEAVLMIQEGWNHRILSAMMNSYTDLPSEAFDL